MKKIIFLLMALVLLAGCVSFDEEEKEQADDILEPVAPKAETAPEPVQPAQNVTEPNPLAPLPKSNTSNIAPRPKAVVVNATNTTKPANKTVQKGWTTESLSIEEGETKYIYIKQ
jgi:hypothetical protein